MPTPIKHPTETKINYEYESDYKKLFEDREEESEVI